MCDSSALQLPLPTAGPLYLLFPLPSHLAEIASIHFLLHPFRRIGSYCSLKPFSCQSSHQNVRFSGVEVFADFACGSFVGLHSNPGTEVMLSD